MATKANIADQAWRALRAQGIDRRLEDVESDIVPALLDVSREAMYTPHRTELETVLSLTLGSADSQGLQTAAITSTVFEESVTVSDDVYHTGVSRFELKPSVGHLLRLLSTSTVPCYTVTGTTLTARRPSGSLPTTASALKVKAVLKVTDVTALPASLDHLLVARLIVLGGGVAPSVEPQAA